MRNRTILETYTPEIYDGFPNSNIVRPKIKGYTTVKNFFGKIPKKIDILFQRVILDSLGKRYSDKEKIYVLFRTEKGNNSDTRIINELCITEFSSPAEIRANLGWLNKEDNHFFLEIDEEEGKVFFILGYPDSKITDGIQHVAFVQHELKDGKEEIHFRLCSIDKWGNNTPRGFGKSDPERYK